jgi:PTH1 family peptidyl-tRNA hydrolase
VIGLGNPGPRYAETRHNAGFWFADALAAASGTRFRPESKFHGEACEARLDGQPVRVLKPMTYMNHSGRAIAALARFYKLTPAELLVVHDELDFAAGIVRLKQGGGHGGHNGLRDTVAQLGDRGFWRLRIGIGHPGHRDEVINYVLDHPGKDERRAVDDAIRDGIAALPLLLAGDSARALQRLNT